MAQSLVGNIKRYKDLAWLLIRYGRSDLAAGVGEESVNPGPDGPEDAEDARDLAKDLEKLGPTFVKVGQLLSTRADLLPPAYLAALSRLQDSVEPFSFAEVEEIVQSELGVRLSKGFLEFEETPIAAASLGQVHRARLRDGRVVAVKVQRPGIRETILGDLEAFGDLARFLDKHAEFAGRYEFEKMVDEFRHVLLAELDYRQEARNLRVLGENLRTFDRIVVPEPIDDYTSERVLTMDYVRGSKITALSPLARIDLDGEGLAEELFQAYLQQTLVDGFFHADPHPGNVFVTDDGRIALIDLGMTARFSVSMQEALLKLLLAVAEGHGDQAAERASRIGRQREGFDSAEFRRRVGAVVAASRDASVEELQVGRVLLELTRAAGETGLQLPSELTLLGKTLLNLDQVARVLAPDFDPNASVRRNTAVLLRKRLFKSTTPGSLASAALDTKEFLEKLPSRANRLLDLIAGNQLRLRVDAIDEEMLIEGLHKIANRIALGLVLASLIVGAALLMQVPTSFRIFGYPGLAMILFLAAAAGGFTLALSIVVSDRKKPRSRSPGAAA
jgi:ubiquinone biosynthesis protein